MMTTAEKLLDPFVNIPWCLIVVFRMSDCETIQHFKVIISPYTHSIESSVSSTFICPPMPFQ